MRIALPSATTSLTRRQPHPRKTLPYGARARAMIDNFALLISHGLILLAAWRLVQRPDLDDDAAPPVPRPVRWRPRPEDGAGA